MNKRKYMGDGSLCDCETVYTVEEHGDSYAIYYGRCNHKHGYNLGLLTETSPDVVTAIEESLNKYKNT